MIEHHRRVLAEVGRYPGARAWLEPGGKHYRIHIEYGGRRKFVVVSGSPATCKRSLQNKIGDVRRTLRELGAARA